MTETQGPRATLVFGGARSGKSRFAEGLAVKSGLEKIYVATGAAFDSEMAERISQHRLQRGPSWTTVEEPLDLCPVLQAHCRADRVVLVDCLTLWLSNLLFSEKDPATETARLCEAVLALSGPCIFVSNEVGMGIVPENRLSRSFRDAQGRLNQDMARVCRQVVFVAAGLPLVMKPQDQPEIDL
ncbi:bifunctional adenosylcobinamide kinase/adenosylcobinamide-phosphate guanylyltransferase [Roseibium aggregatum]|uniref:Bifunctional adenosylcobalamin biosynthesis protein n=1 Tax=Roseibium aggregatum TaxID=187304 RepID=A0A939ED84_9HYPH|nr:bifunctional adenosylcobinamide kinase/adenosylcobinamide-phosphate guanylyltransferase [Roseibium aggregatum]MBN9670432.1 bifunctional adenosylcobinamide kinase/adenosylcobinamide-phosphate guanylyltransferase [Roseibium aggregatum]